MGLATCKHRQLSNPHMMVKFPSQTPIHDDFSLKTPIHSHKKKYHTDKRPQTVWGGKKLIYQTQATVVKQ